MMGLPWFRMYAESVDDEKLRLLAFEDRWHFVALLCMKARGILDEQDETLLRRKVAVKLGLAAGDADEVKRRLMEVGLIDDRWNPKAWDKRQFVSDVSTIRVRKLREKMNETDMKRFRNVSETPPDIDTDRDKDRDTEREKEKKSRGAPTAACAPASRSPAAGRASRLSIEALPEEWEKFCRDRRPDLEPAETFSRFRDYWAGKPGKDGRKVDWLATWRNWVRNERPPLKPKPTNEKPEWMIGIV